MTWAIQAARVGSRRRWWAQNVRMQGSLARYSASPGDAERMPTWTTRAVC